MTGYRYDRLHPEALHAVLEWRPRLELKRESAPMFRAQSAANPHSRADFYTRFLEVNWFVRHAPLAE